MTDPIEILHSRALMAFFLTCGDLILLTFIMPGALEQGVHRRKEAFLWCANFILLFFVYCFQSTGSLYSYIFLFCLYLCYWFFLHTIKHLPLRSAAYTALWFFLTATCVDSILRFASMRLFHVDYLRAGTLLQRAGAITVQIALLAGILMLLKRWLPDPTSTQMNRTVLWAGVLASIPYLFVCQITVWLPLKNEQLTTAIPITLAITCLLALAMQITVVGQLQAEIEKRKAQQSQWLMEQRQQQFLIHKASSDALRRNYHDLKNILLYLEQASNKDEIREYTRRVMGEIKPFEVLVQTGNETMDILLGEKLSLCQSENIACTVDLEGALFDFVDPLELCTIVGNAMDNAIEASLKLEDPAQRRILVKSARRGDYSLFSVRNACPDSIDPSLRTTKPNPEEHGYGLSNIRRAAEAYNGEVSCQQSNGTFLLTVLLLRPMK